MYAMSLSLSKSYKNRFNFKIGTTSFIYPDKIVANVVRLAPHLDEIELLLFQGQSEDSFLSVREMDRLVALAGQYNLSYNVHLPIDVSVNNNDPEKRRQACKVIKKVIDYYKPLAPSTHTLHLPCHLPGQGKSSDPDAINKWQSLTEEALDRLMALGISARVLSIETLDYPFEWAQPVIKRFNLPVCIDVGHVVRHGFDLAAIFNIHFQRTAIIHLHGATGQNDHLALSSLDARYVDILKPWLIKFEGTLSLEVFSLDKLADSLKALEKIVYG